jgi:hypothetical protein
LQHFNSLRAEAGLDKIQPLPAHAELDEANYSCTVRRNTSDLLPKEVRSNAGKKTVLKYERDQLLIGLALLMYFTPPGEVGSGLYQ